MAPGKLNELVIGIDEGIEDDLHRPPEELPSPLTRVCVRHLPSQLAGWKMPGLAHRVEVQIRFCGPTLDTDGCCVGCCFGAGIA